MGILIEPEAVGIGTIVYASCRYDFIGWHINDSTFSQRPILHNMKLNRSATILKTH